MSEKNFYTGRKYKCLSTVEINKRNWSHKFKVGQIYNEIENKNLPGFLLMLEPKGEKWNLIGLYVDSCQFEIVIENEK